MLEQQRSASREDVSDIWPRYTAASLGFRNYWYPVMWSSRLGKKPQTITLCGEKIVLVRDQGVAYALHDRCPHRGIPLSEGRCDFPGLITCAYHGWCYDLRTGELAAVLTDGPDSPIVGKRTVQVETYPVAERAGLVWVYVGEQPAPPVEADVPSELLRPNTVVVGVIQRRRGNWRYAAENGVDEGHAKYLHRRTPWTFFREVPAWNVIHLGPSDDGEWQLRIPDHTLSADTYPRVGRWPQKRHFWESRSRGPLDVGARLPGWVRVRRQRWAAYEAYVPSDETHYLSVLFLAKWTAGPGAWLFQAWYWLWRRWAYHWRFNAQDQRMVESMQTPPERLYRPDVSITAWRKMCQTEARGSPAARAPATEGARDRVSRSP
jgi:phenylpropionate dioxygenase-like ring-hydroxylating dioxygenase large terminal subunit